MRTSNVQRPTSNARALSPALSPEYRGKGGRISPWRVGARCAAGSQLRTRHPSGSAQFSMSDAPQKPPASSLVPQDLRIDYGRGELDEADLAADPFQQFARWFEDARTAGVPEANAM